MKFTENETKEREVILDEISNSLIDYLKTLQTQPQAYENNIIRQKCQDLFNHLFKTPIDTTYTAERRLFAFKDTVEPVIAQ